MFSQVPPDFIAEEIDSVFLPLVPNHQDDFQQEEQNDQLSTLPANSPFVQKISNISHKKKSNQIKNMFTYEEDQKIIQAYTNLRSNPGFCWADVSKIVGGGRTPRQCRERYRHYLDPDIRNGKWTLDEEMLLQQKYNEFGPCWSKIAGYFNGRTDVNVKNHWTIINKKRCMKANFVNQYYQSHRKVYSHLNIKSSHIRSNEGEINHIFKTSNSMPNIILKGRGNMGIQLQEFDEKNKQPENSALRLENHETQYETTKENEPMVAQVPYFSTDLIRLDHSEDDVIFELEEQLSEESDVFKTFSVF